jgi:hypothetical protein
VRAGLLPGTHGERSVVLRNTGGAPLQWKLRVHVDSTTSSPGSRSGARASLALERKRPFASTASAETGSRGSRIDEPSAPGHDGATSEPPSLEQVLANLDLHFDDVTAAIPGRFDFLEGARGDSIVDGGEHMYRGGNRLYSGGPLHYTEGELLPFASVGRYFTRKYPGLFVLAADTGYEGFHVFGILGNRGLARVDAATLRVPAPAGDFTAFVKRVFGAPVPSVNHLTIVLDAGTETRHTALTGPEDDRESLTNLPRTRLYYLLFAARSGGYLDDSVMTEVARRFVHVVQQDPWLRVSPDSGIVSPGGSQTLALSLDATGLPDGRYQAMMEIESNDRVQPRIEVPVSLAVGPPVRVGLRIEPRTLNTSSNGQWITAEITLPPPLVGADVVQSSVRLNGTVAVVAKPPSSGEDHDDGEDEVGQDGGGQGDGGHDDGHRRSDRRYGQSAGGEEDGDGEGDDGGSATRLTLKFDRAALALVLPPGDSAAIVLTGELSDGRPIEGRDVIRILRPRGIARELAADVVLELALTGAVPNPFDDATTVAFALPRKGNTRLEVFDLLGRRVRVLADGEREPGRYQIRWDGRDGAGRRLAGGVYVLRLDAAGVVLTRRVARIE